MKNNFRYIDIISIDIDIYLSNEQSQRVTIKNCKKNID